MLRDLQMAVVLAAVLCNGLLGAEDGPLGRVPHQEGPGRIRSKQMFRLGHVTTARRVAWG